MAESTDFVDAFLKDIKEKLTPIAKLELDALLNLKRAHIGSTKSTDNSGVVPEEAGTFRFWDFSYYSNLTKVWTHSFDVKKFSEYFSLERSLEGMMSTFSRLFGLQFCKITADPFSKFGPEHVMTWHPDEIVLSIWEDAINSGDFLGYFMIYIGVSWMFLNCAVDPAIPDSPLYSNHAGYYNLRPGFISLSGERQYPASALFMNLPKPLSNMLGLLKHNDARSLFHEPGHAIHNQTTRTRYAIFHGTTARDFGGIPSIKLEN
ncbi:hypothetical protein F5882DRAFT_455539 [Hyaloscypha sp. PMI_1271]|nr:hypothetical protein F5882DRAFT_455539 [Hyaloscypha sp. PMI_1271]